MFSLGIEASFALRTAFSSVALAAGSPPPSRAATMIARASLEKCAPRRESTTAFLCLIEAHFECPDITEILGVEHRAGPAVPASGPAVPVPLRRAQSVGFGSDQRDGRRGHLQGL